MGKKLKGLLGIVSLLGSLSIWEWLIEMNWIGLGDEAWLLFLALLTFVVVGIILIKDNI